MQRVLVWGRRFFWYFLRKPYSFSRGPFWSHWSRQSNFDNSINQLINIKIICLNEAEAHTGRKVFKTTDKKLDETDIVESDLDAELLFVIPYTIFSQLTINEDRFTQHVKLKSINIKSVSEDLTPVKAKLFVILKQWE